MAKAEKDEFTPVTFTKEVDGQTKELTAGSPADAVRLRFDGWRETGRVSKTAPVRSTPSTKTAGDAGV